MKRLTMWYDGNHAICEDEECSFGNCPFADPVCEQTQSIIDRLAAIEDILGEEYELDRLRELVEADRMALTCKPGDIVYQKDTERIYELEIQKIIYDCGHIAFDKSAIGKTVFLTRDEAEAALKAREQE